MTSRKFFILFIACAAIPLIAAKLSLSQGWFQQGSTNKGQWLQHEIQILPGMENAISGDIDRNVHWHLVYVQADVCDQQCERALFIMQQLYTGMGRKQIKIKPLLMAQQQPDLLTKFPVVSWQPDVAEASELKNQIVIVNQRGLALLRYSVASNPEQMDEVAKDIRTDLLRLINYDRSGA